MRIIASGLARGLVAATMLASLLAPASAWAHSAAEAAPAEVGAVAELAAAPPGDLDGVLLWPSPPLSRSG